MQEGFVSVNNGVMHACGHDCHATSGLGVAKVLMDIKGLLCRKEYEAAGYLYWRL